MNGEYQMEGTSLGQNDNEAIVAVLVVEVAVADTVQAFHKCLRNKCC